MSAANRLFRRLVPAVPRLSRHRVLMAPLDTADWLLRRPYRELRALPPNRFRIRVGVGNRLLANAVHYQTFATNFWLDAFASGIARPDSDILDVGCGCGRFAHALREYRYHGRKFSGHYTGIDVDREMLAWCRRRFPAAHFSFIEVDAANTAYRPDGTARQERVRFAVEDQSQDLVLANSLFTHLLADAAVAYIREAFRALRPGGGLQISVLRIEDVRQARAPGMRESRWSFGHRLGEAYVEDLRVPEAAVAYEHAYVQGILRDAGFGPIETLPTDTHAIYRATKPAAVVPVVRARQPAAAVKPAE